MQFQLADVVLWMVTTTLMAGVLLAMYTRKLHRRYLFFFNYTILQLAGGLILLILGTTYSYDAYYYAYYANLAGSLAASMIILYEFVIEGLPWHPRLKWSCLLLLSCFVLVIGMNVVNLLGLTSSARADSEITSLLIFFDRSLRWMQVFCAFALFMVGTKLGISSKSVLYGTVMGFGLFAAANLMVATALLQHGFWTSAALSRINSGAYVCACLIWLVYTVFGAADPSGFDRSNPVSARINAGRKPKFPGSRFFRGGGLGTSV